MGDIFSSAELGQPTAHSTQWNIHDQSSWEHCSSHRSSKLPTGIDQSRASYCIDNSTLCSTISDTNLTCLDLTGPFARSSSDASHWGS